ncbi:MAG TPA: AzlD domain-containing protein [Mycobacteriales bacterium]|nr:AzlD domain-containing protein [Mycobacteriales bacterium]
MTRWVAVLACSAGCYALKAAGLAVPARWLARPRLQRVINLSPVPLLAALVATGALASGTRLVPDARLVGLAVAALLLWRRQNFLVVVLGATIATALIRLA